MTDDEPIESDSLFSRPARTLLGKWRHSWLRHVPRIGYTVLVTRNITSDTQTLDPLTSSRTPNRIAVNPYSFAAFSETVVGTWGTRQIGDIFSEASAVSVGGDAAFPAAVPDPPEAYEVLFLLATFVNDATVASRTARLLIDSGLSVATGFGLTSELQSGALTLTANEDGAILMCPNGTTYLNDNGTITSESTSPLPAIVPGITTFTASYTAGVQAGDASRIAVIARRVA